MPKMKLDMDRLTVESFETVAGTKHTGGTIRGNADTLPGFCTPACSVHCTRYESCGETLCADACPPTPACSGPCSYIQSCIGPTICGDTCPGTCQSAPLCC